MRAPGARPQRPQTPCQKDICRDSELSLSTKTTTQKQLQKHKKVKQVENPTARESLQGRPFMLAGCGSGSAGGVIEFSSSGFGAAWGTRAPLRRRPQAPAASISGCGFCHKAVTSLQTWRRGSLAPRLGSARKDGRGRGCFPANTGGASRRVQATSDPSEPAGF